MGVGGRFLLKAVAGNRKRNLGLKPFQNGPTKGEIIASWPSPSLWPSLDARAFVPERWDETGEGRPGGL